METSFFTGFGHLCRFACIAAIVVTSINATLHESNYFTIRDSADQKQNLVGFRAETTKNKKLALKWKTAVQGNFTYVVEKSRDGENFSEVESTNIKTEDGEYTWVDAYPKMVNCYRLRITDENGASSYSKTLVIQVFKSGEVSLVGATPDLSANDINVDVEMKETAMVTLNITDKDGKIVMQQKEKAKEGINQYSIKGSSTLLPGDYFLKVVVNGTDCLLVHLIKS